MNEKTRTWYNKLKNNNRRPQVFHVKSRNVNGNVERSKHDSRTTTHELPDEEKQHEGGCMRSSDDSTTKYLSNSAENNKLCVIRNKQNLSLIGINLSPDKTFFLPEGIAEYTSWYIDGKFVSQYGTEVPSIRPQGKSPYDDLYAIAKGTSTLLQTLVINPLGATARIRIGVSACKKV